MFKHHRTQWGLATPRGLAWVFLLSLLMGLFLFGCNEAPFQPKDDEPVVKDYRAWFWKGSLNSRLLFSYHTATGEVDSVTIPWELTSNPTVSHDGSLIYVPAGDVVKVLETDSFTTVGEIQHSVRKQVVVSPDGQYAVLFGDSTWIVRTSDYATIYSDTIRVNHGHFSINSQNLYTAHFDASRISLADPEQITSEVLIDNYSVGRVIPTPDESKLLIYFGVATFVYGVGIYDLALDTLVNYDLLTPGVSDVAMTPDGKLAFYGNPGNMAYHGPSELTVYDVESNRMLKRWNMNGLIEEYTIYGTPVGEMVISPDGLWLLFHLGPINQSQTVIQWNIQQERVENYYLGLGKGASGISIQLVE